MMSAILKIKPQLDQAEAAKMEKSLFARFKNVGKTVKKTLKDVVSGGLLGFAVGLAQSMLSPIEEVENRIKSMLDRATDLRDISEEFGTSAGKMQNLQNVAMINGLKPDQLKSMMESFKQTVDEAENKIFRKEDLDEKTSLVKGFVGSKDMAEAFFQFVQSLREIQGQQRESIEKSLFGKVMYGGAKRFIDNAGVVSMANPNPNVQAVNNQVEKLSTMGDNYQLNKMIQDQEEMRNYAISLNERFINGMVANEERQKARELRQLQNYDELAKARLAIDKLNGIMENITGLLTKLVTYLGDFITYLQKAPWAKGFMKVIGVK